jgi:hypothetical protein
MKIPEERWLSLLRQRWPAQTCSRSDSLEILE